MERLRGGAARRHRRRRGRRSDTLRLAEAVRVLALRHGAPAVRHCTDMVESLRRLSTRWRASGRIGREPDAARR